MAGVFLLGSKPTRPGAYFRRQRVGYTVEGAINGVLAVMYQSNWGALNKVVEFDQTMLNNVDEYAGTGADIIREGLLGGAITVRAVRVGGDDGTCSKVILKTSGSSSKDAVEISAKYPGNRAFTVSVDTDLLTDNRRFRIYDGTSIFTQVTFTAGGDEAQALVDAMRTNRHFTALKKNSGVLADVTQQAMTAGTNPTVTTSSYDKGTNALERYKWNVIIADSDDAAIKSILSAFVKQSYDTGHWGMACIAGQSTQDLDTRMQLAASYNDEKMVYVLNGWIDNTGATYDGWKAAARIGGMIARVETNTSLTHTVISNAYELIEPLTNGEITQAEKKGCFVLSLNDSDQVWVDNSINTLITEGTDQDAGWKKIRRTKCRFELMDRINSTHDKLVGKVNNDSNGRATVMAAAQRVINEMVAEEKLVAGSYIELDEAHPPEGDTAHFTLHIRDYDSLEFIMLTYEFAYGQTFDAAA